jgi:hypothetical protein
MATLITEVALNYKAKTTGKQKNVGYSFTAKALDKTKLDILVPAQTKGWDVVEGACYSATATLGDRVWIEGAPNLDVNAALGGGALGKLSAAITANSASSISLNAGSVALMEDNGMLDEGLYLRLTQKDDTWGANDTVPADYMDMLALVVDWNRAADTITLAANYPRAAAIDDKVYVTRRFADGIWFFPGVLEKVGEAAPGGSNLPSGQGLRIIYQNTAVTDLTMRFNLAYLHGRVK